MSLISYVNQVFGQDGLLVQMGGRHTIEQLQYSTYIAESIQNQNFNLSFLEAETGIGKSLGYLVPIMINIALHQNANKPINKYVVSTFTRQLQKQITTQDIELVNKILKNLGLDNHILAAYRMGKQAFFSLTRTKNCCNRLINASPNRKAELDDFYQWVQINCESGSGLWSDYSEDYGALPVGIRSQDICLLHKQIIDNNAYQRHLDLAKEADVIITNHMSILQSKHTGLNDLKIEAIVFDEAHTITDQCRELFNHHTNINEIRSIFSHAEELFGSRQLKSSFENLEDLNTLIRSHPNFQTIDYICEANNSELFQKIQQQVKKLSNNCLNIQKLMDKNFDKANLELAEVEFINNLELTSSALKAWYNEEKSKFSISAVSVSKVQKRISLATINIYGNRIFASIAKSLSQRIILTSATLSDIKLSKSFTYTKKDLGFGQDDINFECSLAPSNYGQMNFVLTDHSIPKPIINDDESFEFHPIWLNNTVKMINEARANNEPLLILTVSHSESQIIYKALDDQASILLHKSNTSLNELVPDFLNNDQFKVLITSSGWEGLNLRSDNGKQFLKNIVVTRIPFIPPNPLHEFLIKAFIKHIDSTNHAGSTLSLYENLKKVVPKLKQGFGRGIRGPEDSITIWICDSRMPVDGFSNLATLLNAIPNRFRANYSKARIFGQKKKEMIYI